MPGLHCHSYCWNACDIRERYLKSWNWPNHIFKWFKCPWVGRAGRGEALIDYKRLKYNNYNNDSPHFHFHFHLKWPNWETFKCPLGRWPPWPGRAGRGVFIAVTWTLIVLFAGVMTRDKTCNYTTTNFPLILVIICDKIIAWLSLKTIWSNLERNCS